MRRFSKMAYVHEIKFFTKDNQLYAAFYDHPPIFLKEFWIMNVKAKELGIQTLPPNVKLGKKYKVKDLGIKPFYASKLLFDFIDIVAEKAWKEGTILGIGTFMLK